MADIASIGQQKFQVPEYVAPLTEALQKGLGIAGQAAQTTLTTQQAKWLPYQYQMQALSDPRLWIMAQNNPALQQQLLGMLSNPLRSGAGNNPSLLDKIKGMFGAAQPNAGGQPGGIPGMPMSASAGFGGTSGGFAGNPQGGDPLLQVPTNQQGSPLVPATKGGIAGMIGNITAPYNKSPYDAGATIADPNHPGYVISAPTQKTATAIQNQLLGEQRVAPQLERLADEWAPFMDVKGMSDLRSGQVGSALSGIVSPDTLSKVGFKPNAQLSSQYAKANSTIQSAPEALVKAYGLNATNETLERLEKSIEPVWGENKNTYKQRLLTTLRELRNEQARASQAALQGGFSTAPTGQSRTKAPNTATNEDEVEGQQPPAGTRWMIRTDGKKVPVHESNVAYARSMKWKDVS